MLTVSRIGFGGTATRAPLVMTGRPSGGDTNTSLSPPFISPNMIFWTATARNLGDASTPSFFSNTASRSATTCYMRGLAEGVEINTNSPAMWEWRRICFTIKYPPLNTSYNDNTVGYARYLLNLSASAATGDVTQYQATREFMFAGTFGIDYNNVMIANLDSTRIDIKYDKTRRIASGNQSGVLRRYKMWHPMNKNLVYDDEENGSAMTASNRSVLDKRGMGDYHVVDFFKCQTESASDTLSMNTSATLYWHEK